MKNLIKKILIKLHGTDSCKTMADMPASEIVFSIIRESVEKEYSKYKSQLSEEQYEHYIEEIFQIYKEYKLHLDKVKEDEYKKVYGDYAEKLLSINNKYGVKTKR